MFHHPISLLLRVRWPAKEILLFYNYSSVNNYLLFLGKYHFRVWGSSFKDKRKKVDNGKKWFYLIEVFLYHLSTCVCVSKWKLIWCSKINYLKLQTMDLCNMWLLKSLLSDDIWPVLCLDPPAGTISVSSLSKHGHHYFCYMPYTVSSSWYNMIMVTMPYSFMPSSFQFDIMSVLEIASFFGMYTEFLISLLFTLSTSVFHQSELTLTQL